MVTENSMGGQQMPIRPGETRQFLDLAQGGLLPGKFVIEQGDGSHIVIEPGRMIFEYPDGKGHVLETKTDEAKFVLDKIGDFLTLFLEKNEKYAKVQGAGFPLGIKGVFPDVNRKTGILYDRLWLGNESPGEKTDEVIMDLIGHLFLMLYHFEKEN